MDAKHLEEITFEGDLSHMGANAFSASGLTSFVMTQGMTLEEIPGGAFAGCSALERVTLGGALDTIRRMAFIGCDALESMEIPETVTVIEEMAIAANGVLTLRAGAGSAAHAYALENGIAFIDPDVPAVESLTIKGETRLLLGDVRTLSASVFPQEAAAAAAITWTSSNPDVLYVYDGAAHAVGGGTAILTATAHSGAYTSAEFTVDVPVSAVSLTPAKALLFPGETLQTDVQLLPGNATLTALAFESDSPAVASVDEAGCITALSAGCAVVTARAHSGASAQCVVYVAQSVTPAAGAVTLTPGQRIRIPAKGLPQELAALAEWIVSGEAVSLTQDGWLAAVSAGSACASFGALGRTLFTAEMTVADTLTTLTLPGALSTVEEEAFLGAAVFGRVLAGDGLETIGSRAFAQMPALRQVILPASVKSVASDAFEGSGGAVLMGPDEAALAALAQGCGAQYVLLGGGE